MTKNKKKTSMKHLVITLLCAILAVMANADTWSTDVLKDGYKMRYMSMKNDYSGAVRATIVKKNAVNKSDKAVLYVHGYNDYFFQSEMGNKFIDKGYNFYAVDLRKYGRSLMPGQVPFEARDVKEYFEDLDSAISVVSKDGNKEIILMGHSTGGLTTAYYMAEGKGDRYPIKALILNSPFLDMNLGKFMENIVVPLVSLYSNVSKCTEIRQGSSNSYAQSLLRKYHGEWNYNTRWKKEISPDVTSGWIGAIHKAQKHIQEGANIKVPILLMHSDKSVGGDKWTPQFNRGDVVLDVDDISKYGRKLGRKTTEFVVKDGLHDLVLSRKPVRDALYINIFNWLKKKNL